MVEEARKELRKYASADDAKILQRFFKTGPGEYGEGDIFIGVKVPPVRKTAVKFSGASADDLAELISSSYHEERLLALMILIKQFRKADERKQDEIIKFYLKFRRFINNWDLVDLSAPYITGPYYFSRDRSVLYGFVKEGTLWEKRIAILSSFYFIRQNDFATALEFVEMLLDDRRDLINKACGWMLRETGNRNLKTEENFLEKHYNTMPRTMLRYAIEKFPEEKRLFWLKRK